jgi:membrane associated rhomboid family serine protease
LQSFGRGRGLLPPTIQMLVIINVIVFLLQQIAGRWMTYYLGLVPVNFWHGYLWQVFTYMFLHGGFWHIFFNMFVLWMFGRILEEVWGPKKFLTYYLITGVGAGLINALVMPGSPIPTIGASGAVFGLLLAFGMLFPNQQIYLYFLFPVRAKYFVLIMIAIELFSGLNPNSQVAHFAHLGGMLFGFIYLKWEKWTAGIRRKMAEEKHNQKMKVVWNRRQEIQKLQREVDDLLDKINRRGIESLTVEEKARLKEASRKLKEWEEKGFSVN